MKNGRISRCPYCGRLINYFYLYDSKRYDFGYCSHCGGIYVVKYSPVAYLLALAAFGLVAGGFAYCYLANKSVPGYLYLAECVVAVLLVYFLLPFFIAPRKCLVKGRLGGFPSPEQIPAYCPRFSRRARVQVSDRQTEIFDELQQELQSAPSVPVYAGKSTGSNTSVKLYKQEKNSDPESAFFELDAPQTGSQPEHGKHFLE